MLHPEVNPFKNNPAAARKGSVRHPHRQGGAISGASCCAPSPPPGSIEAWAEPPARVPSLGPGSGCTARAGRALRWLQIGCLLLTFPSDSEACSEYLDRKYAPRAESERGRCCSCWNPSPPPRRVPGANKGVSLRSLTQRMPCKLRLLQLFLLVCLQ